MKYSIYIIIVTFNGEKWIRKCLQSIFQDEVDFTVVVVDNGSTDSTCEIIETEFSSIKLIKNTQNLGFGKANNIGLRMAYDSNADYVLLLNQDAWLDADAIIKLIKLNLENPEYGILSPMQMNGLGTQLDRYFARLLNEDNAGVFVNDLFMQKQKQIYEVKFVMAAMWLISARCLRSVGFFDPIFHHYGEDNDYVNRCIYHGFKIGICPNVKGYHDREYRTIGIKKQSIYMDYVSILVQLMNVNNSFFNVSLSLLPGYFLRFPAKYIFSNDPGKKNINLFLGQIRTIKNRREINRKSLNNCRL